VSREKKPRSEETRIVKLDETANVLIQLFNILLEGVAKDKQQMREDVISEFNRLIGSLSLYVDMKCLDPYTRYLLESNLMADVILSHLERLEGEEGEEGWLKLSGRTRALIAVALARCGRPSKISIRRESEGAGLRVEKI